MPLSSPRADNLSFMRDILILISRGEITDWASFEDYLSKKKGWKKARRYHYLSALRELHFIKEQKNFIKLEEAGKKIVQIGASSFGDLNELSSSLSEQEKEFFRNYLLYYPNFVRFLSFFLENKEMLNNYSTFLSKAKVIGFEFDKNELNKTIVGQDGNKKRLSGWKLIKSNDESESLSITERHEIMWTLKNWGKRLDLIDEIWIPKFRDYPNRFQKILFPIKVREGKINLDIFQEWLDELIREYNYSSNYIPIPILMYDFCTNYFVNVKTFQRFLCLLYFRSPGEYYLDKISRAFIDERLHRIGRGKEQKREDWSNYTNYPKVDDFYRSHLVVRTKKRGKYGKKEN